MSDQQVLDVLVAARALIVRPGGWCQRTGERHGGADDGGTAYCAVAALHRTGLTGELDVIGSATNELRLALPADWVRARNDARNPGPVRYNDEHERTLADIIAMYDTAIGRVRARIAATDWKPYEGLLVSRP